MAKLFFCEQYSDKYDHLKYGLATSSNFKNIITPSGFSSEGWMDYACALIAERCTGKKIDTYQSQWMDRGLIMEQEAADMYSQMRKVDVKKIGFISNDEGTIGCTPDRLIGDDGLLEIKVPKPSTQIKYLITGEVHKAYWPQLQGQLYVSERRYVDIISYHPTLPPAIMHVERDEAYIACMHKLIFRFNSYIEKIVDKIAERTELTYKKGISDVQEKILPKKNESRAISFLRKKLSYNG